VPTTRIACLLPVRNGAEDLPGFLASAARVCDAVVALDDGSTDATRAVLDASPLVRVVLSNPPRADARGWDDGANRNRLLEAAAALDPAWVLSLDADERIDAADAAALRAFVETEAVPGHAYGFLRYRMVGDLGHYAVGDLESPSRVGLWVYRLFAFEPGQRFPNRPLHFVPVPTAIPRERWVRTTVRIQHLASLTEERRQAHIEQYRQVDPEFGPGLIYRDLLAPTTRVEPWEPRPPRLAVVGGPAISAIVISRNDEDRIAQTVASVVGQDCPRPFEVIVVTSGTDRTAQIVRERFPEATLVELPRPALPGEARNAGLAVARGEYVTFPGSHIELKPGSLAARLRAHERGHPMVTATVLNGTRTRAGWASYFLDHSTTWPGRPSGELSWPPGHCSYRHAALLMAGGFPEDLRAGEDTVVNHRLWRLGYGAWLEQGALFVHHSRCRGPRALVRHHFVRGRAMGRILVGRHGGAEALLASGMAGWLAPGQVTRRLRRIRRNVRAWGGDLATEYRLSSPLVVAGAVAYWLGVRYEVRRAKAEGRGWRDGAQPAPADGPRA
jgi:glycosyltransferase involved in cell wall biosynthesis